jgi:hypothetical protein
MYLSDKQHKALKREARRQGVSMTELLRRIVDEHLVRASGTRAFPKEAVLSFIGLGESGSSDTSERHDEALDEALREGTLR